MEQILVIDDDVDLCALISEYLEPEGFDLEIVHSGEQGLERALSGQPAMVVLDVMLPGINGFEVLRRIRAKSQVPVLMLTARGHDVDRIVGLEIGADDYLPKPFNPRELVARMRAILRRTRKGAQLVMDEVPVESIKLADVEVDLGGRVVRKNGESLFVTTAEFEILVCLLRSAGKVVTREELSETALGRRFNPLDRSIDVHVSNIRRKLGNLEDGAERIKSIRGVGYLYAHSATL
ncbi:MAG: response regulator transcription factor [Blastocatellia bacterium]|nr:response regulator transcription factor [Blastocatellia bacterium]